jgi:hypothetical protein
MVILLTTQNIDFTRDTHDTRICTDTAFKGDDFWVTNTDESLFLFNTFNIFKRRMSNMPALY